jgi:DNA-binding MarR family transcriptional regulator
MKLTEKQLAVVNYIKDNGGRVAMEELCAALGSDAKHLNPVVTTLGVKGPRAKGLVDYEKIAVEGEEKPVKYVFLTDEGKAFDPDAIDED